MNGIDVDDPESWDVLESGAFLLFSSRISLGSQTVDKEAQKTLRFYFVQERLGKCRMTCSSCVSVLQQSPQSKQVVTFVPRKDCFDVQSKCSYSIYSIKVHSVYIQSR